MIRIKVEGKNVADLFRLECVDAIQKQGGGIICVSVRKERGEDGEYIHKHACNDDEIQYESESAPIGTVIPNLPF